MPLIFLRPVLLLLILALCTFIPVMMALVRVVRIPMGSYPDDTARLAAAPVARLLLYAAVASDFILAGLWSSIIAFAEWIIRHIQPQPQTSRGCT